MLRIRVRIMVRIRVRTGSEQGHDWGYGRVKLRRGLIQYVYSIVKYIEGYCLLLSRGYSVDLHNTPGHGT